MTTKSDNDKTPKHTQIPPMPDYVVSEAGGVMKAMINYMERTCFVKQPSLFLLAAIILTGTLTDRRYRLQNGRRLNIYGVSLAESGAGKEHPRQCIQLILDACGMFHCLGGERVASSEAILSRLSNEPNTLFQMDEFGTEIGFWTKRSSGTTKKKIGSQFHALFRSSETAVCVLDPTSADIEHPHVFIHGSSIPEPFWKAAKSAKHEKDLFNQFLIIQANERCPERNLDPENMEVVPDAIVSWHNLLKETATIRHTIFGHSTAKPMHSPDEPYIIPFESGAEKALQSLTRHATEFTIELSEKLAAIRAVSRDPKCPKITMGDIAWGYTLANESAKTLKHHTS